ncbi:PhnD/SsuA/transferrin family substrate-binding protein [Candidatus Amarobacter glycogenicus]|uniref:PhnD/SsuA/transferrin family substrate-binding protein n=1 Tax=Candidatus Amarobacter glycogenicus TaxID=3140699 RepID=UPI0031CC82D6
MRAYIARMRIKTDLARSLLLDTIDAARSGREDAMLKVLEVKAAAGELSTEVTDLGMRVCGGAAFRKEVGVERHFRDSRAATAMAPTADVLYGFIGRAACGPAPLLTLLREVDCDVGETLVPGAVAYDPKVVTIWEGFRRYLGARGLAFDYVLYSNYESQVDALLSGNVQVAWNSPLAWLNAERRAFADGLAVSALCMRDTDLDNRSVIVSRAADSVRSLADLRGRTVAVGATDSPQATLIPLAHLARQGLRAGIDIEVLRHEVLAGLHGDHVGGERQAAESLVAGEAAAACLHGGTTGRSSKMGSSTR